MTALKPQEFSAAFKPILDTLDAAGVTLTTIELGNEINTSRLKGISHRRAVDVFWIYRTA